VRALRGRRRVSLVGDSRLRLAGLVAGLVLVADQMTKAIVAHGMRLHQTITLVPLHDGAPLLPFLGLTYVRNTGAAFGVLAAAPTAVRLPLFLVVTVVAVGALVSFLRSTSPDRRWLVGALGGILGGALGNLICRVRLGEVIDFFDVHWRGFQWPMFNVADSAITVGVAIVLLHGLRGRE
jgi:signal peptidase II